MISMLDDQAGMPEMYTKSELMRRIKFYLRHLPVGSQDPVRLKGVTIHDDPLRSAKLVSYYGITTLRINFDNSVTLIE